MNIELDRLSIEAEAGVYWVMDWVSGPYGNTTILRYHFSFKTKPHAEAFVKAIKRAIRKTP